MRGRKRTFEEAMQSIYDWYKKRIPEWGDGNILSSFFRPLKFFLRIKKESPNKGTETFFYLHFLKNPFRQIKKESPNEGTEKTMME